MPFETKPIADDERAVLDAVPTGLLIGGQWRDASGGRTSTVEDPSTATPIAAVADASPEDAIDALGAACAAFADFRSMAPRGRGDILRRAYHLLIARSDKLALLMTLEMGKPLAESRSEVLYAAAYLRWYAEESVRINGRAGSHEDGGSLVLTRERPVGPCLFITPWNFPLAMGARKIAPALAAGCTTIVKPAPQTPLTMLMLGRILEEAGAPPGVVNVIPSRNPAATLAPLFGDDRLRKLSFTGSTTVGKLLMASAADKVLRVSMELGGNAPFIVFSDADLDRAVEGAVVAKMRNMGEACTAANRFLVHTSVSEEFVDRLATALGAMHVGRGTEAGVQVGPLIDAAARDNVGELVTEAIDAGARVVTGGCAIPGAGHFFAPTVLADVPGSARLLHEEIFGPVAPITTFASDDEAITMANATEYGLAAYLYTRDLKRAFATIEGLDTGMVAVNQGVVSNAGAPFGGVKHSGFGREGGPEGLREYLTTTYVALNVD